MKPPMLSRVLCPQCTRPGGLRIFVEYISNTVPLVQEGELWVRAREVPVLSCSLPGCGLILVGRIDGDHAVFPDPHVQGKSGHGSQV